ncbi:MAG: lipid-A-disaccharide synthase [Sulfuricurvum sp. RIFOXYD2_FULL_44_160]|uniref:Lipid-A-disaccharide synthase n=1 Tax=Sulfuricurvum kujiense TaxID=148813 RepID=A0A2D3WDK9_9BACT|nr:MULTISPECIES: lipid-A-disaccharide synthase [Sulfuricurvum]OHD91345.1 MAG: lipid-A-disaccharide synthase [Sulfuricurvum sp. RIFOXYD12_FULL_44_77]OHD92041.1 MAG: lipid-A-disaccharide synthase [Sulfuricurvum sp. RIFOXYD2_FULL_44_160]DAB39391.1 MAG TPA: lipid-A-disaccharide synthase [Sulfuricurvum kujiense]
MKLLVSALEHSANVHLSYLLKELGEEVVLSGIFDNTLGESIVDLRSTSVMGFVDAIKKLPFFFRLKDQMVELSASADKVLLIDSSGFNLPLAKAIRKHYPDKEIIYYILPQAWAWKKKRIPVLEKTITKLCSILPFEPSYYSKDAPIEYVGHPLLDEITIRKTSLEPTGKITFMPGSRPGEIKRLMPVFRELRSMLETRALIVIPPHFTAEQISELYGDISTFEITHEAHQSLAESDFAFICSGTATLEASLIGTPFILAYIAKSLDYAIASRLVKLNYVGLGNILFSHKYGRKLHPEFIQNSVNAQNLYNAYQQMDKTAFFNDAASLRELLGHGSAQRVSTLIKDNNA